MIKPEAPTPRCPHGVQAPVTKNDEGWIQPLGPHNPIGPRDRRGCRICVTGAPIGLAFKLDGEGTNREEKQVSLVECPKPGCVLIVEKDVGHQSPCLVLEPDQVKTWTPEFNLPLPEGSA